MRVITKRKLVLVVLTAAVLGIGLTLGLRAQGTQQPQQKTNALSNPEQLEIARSGHGTANPEQLEIASSEYGIAADYFIRPDLRSVAAASDLVVKGEVLPGKQVPIDIGGRVPFPHAINPVKVITVFKGTAPADTISVGEMVISSEGGWRLEQGRPVYLFLERVEHGAYRYTVPYDYFTKGPQGQYYVRSGLIEPKGDAHLATTKQFKGVKEEVFVQELRRAIEP